MARRTYRRRDFLKTAGLTASLLASPKLVRASLRGERHNILFIHTDSWDGRVLGCMGHPAMRRATPNIDRLAARGTLFRNAYCNNPVCCPSRSSMMSGLFTHHCEGWNNYKGLEPGDPTFRTLMDDAGYQGEYHGKTDYLSGAHTIRARVSGWTRSANIARPQYRMDPPRMIPDQGGRDHEPDWQDVDRTLKWLQNAGADDRPFMLYLGIRQPHPAFTASQRYLDMIDEDGVHIPRPDREDHPAMRYQRLVKNWEHGFSDEMVRQVRRIYFAMCAEVDAMVGRVLDELEAKGFADSTYVVFSSDHGENAMEHNLFYKMNMYESSAHVPLIVAGPGVAKGHQVQRPVSLVDLYPTYMDMSGLDTPSGLDGHSLMPELAGGSADRPGWVLSEYHDSAVNTGNFMLRLGDWKYVVYVGQPPQLFNLKDDPDELCNVATARADVVRRIDGLLRSIVDYEAVDAKVKAYDRASFAEWRVGTKSEGVYEPTMARIFAGWDGVNPEDAPPWTAEDEALIDEWLKG